MNTTGVDVFVRVLSLDFFMSPSIIYLIFKILQKGNLKQGYTWEGCCANFLLFERSNDSFANFYKFCYCCFFLIANIMLHNYHNFVPNLALTAIRDKWYCNFHLKHNCTYHVNATVKINFVSFSVTYYCISCCFLHTQFRGFYFII